MKTKIQFTNRILSLVLAVVMLLSMLPTMSMTAYAATEVENLGENTSIPYTDGLTQYFKYDNYLYQVTFTNLKATDRTVSLRIYSEQIYLSLIGTDIGTSLDLYKDRGDQNSTVTTSDLPKAEGGALSCYLLDAASLGLQRPSIEWANSTSDPVVIIRCVSASGPQWNWASDHSSATAVFTVSESDACVTMSADVHAAAEVCAQETQIAYTACVTFNGIQYTDEQTAIGILDHNWGEMEGKPCYKTCSRCDAVRVVGHSVDGDHCTVCGDALYGVLVAGNHISSQNASDVLGDGTISYDAATNTLILSGAAVDASELNVPALEITDGAVTLVLRGDNALISYHSVLRDEETGEWDSYPAISIAEGASVIITGDASATLELAGNDFGYTTYDHIPSASAVSGGSLTVNGGRINTENNSGIRLGGDYTQTGGTVSVGYLEAQNAAVSGGTLESKGWSGISPQYWDSNAGGIHGIFAQKDITISGGSVTTSSGVLGHDGNYIGAATVTGDEVVTHGLYALESITISGGTVTSTGGSGGYIIDDFGMLSIGGLTEDDEWIGTPAGAALEAPRWSISDAATFICGSDTSHRGSTQTCKDEQCSFCGVPFEEIDHSYDETTHICSVCGKVETFTVYWTLAGSLMQSTSTYGQDFTQIFTVPENTHLRINGVYLDDDPSVPVNYTYEKGVLTIAAADVPAADIIINCDHYVLVTFHANGGEIIPEEGFPQEGSLDIVAEDNSYWIQVWGYGEEICLRNCAAVRREGYILVDWRDASGQVHQVIPGNGNYTHPTEDVTLYAQWQCNHTIGGVVFRDNGDGATHNGYCGECGELLGNYVERPHDYGDNTHKCVCGKKITPEVTAPTAKENLIYDGTPQMLINSGSTTGGTVQYKLGENGTYGTEIPTATNAGDYTVYYKVIGDENYNDTEPATVIVTIGKKLVSVSATVPDRIYGDDYLVDTSKVDITFDGIVDGDDVGYVVTNAFYHVHTVTDSAPVQVEYNVNGADAGNYQFPEFGDWVAPNYGVQATGRVLPRDIANAEITLGDALVFNGAEQTQTVTAVTVDGLEVTYTVSGNKATNVGVYELTITANTNFTGTKTALYTINPDLSRIKDLDQYNVKSTNKTDVEYVYNQLDNAVTDLASAEKEAEWKEIKDECWQWLKILESVAYRVESLGNSHLAYGIDTVTSADDEALLSIEAEMYLFMRDYRDNMTEEELLKVDNARIEISKLRDRIAETKSEYDRVIAAANGYDEATVTSADKDALIQLDTDIFALALTNNVTAEEKNTLMLSHSNVFYCIQRITYVSEEIKRIVAELEKYVFESVKSDDKADIQQLIEDIKALLDTQNITADERTILETADETCDKLIAKIDETVAEINRINDATNAYDIDTVTSADKEDIEKLIADIKTLTDGDNITDAEREQLVANDETLDALLAKINATADEIARIEKAVNGYDEATVKSTDKADLEQLKADIKALTDATNITEDERIKLGELDATVDSLVKKIDDTAAEIERIDEAVNGYDKDTVKSSDIPALGKLIEDIKALTDGDNLTDDERAALEANDEAIDELVEKLTEVAEEIKRVDEAVKSYDEDTVKSTDSDELAQLKEDVQALIDSTNTTENEKTALSEMINDIEGLEGKIEEIEQQLEEIADIENSYNPETVTSDDKAAIEETIAKIEAVNPDNLTDEQKAEYEEIKAGFEALLEEIAAAENAVADIGVELEMFDEKRVTIFWEDDIEALKAKIDELLADENMGEAEKTKLNEYKAQADKLIEIIHTPKEYFSLRFFYFIWDCLTWKYNGILWIFSNLFGC